MGCSLPGSSVHGDFPGKNTGASCHALLQGIFPTVAPALQADSLPLSHQGSPWIRLLMSKADEALSLQLSQILSGGHTGTPSRGWQNLQLPVERTHPDSNRNAMYKQHGLLLGWKFLSLSSKGTWPREASTLKMDARDRRVIRASESAGIPPVSLPDPVSRKCFEGADD